MKRFTAPKLFFYCVAIGALCVLAFYAKKALDIEYEVKKWENVHSVLKKELAVTAQQATSAPLRRNLIARSEAIAMNNGSTYSTASKIDLVKKN